MHDTAPTRPSTGRLGGLIALLRPRQWIKNGFVLAPLIFSGEFVDMGAIADSLVAVVLFCLASSATYVVNDISDRESDRKHPTKSRTRPLASGAVSVQSAVVLLAALYAVLLGGALFMPHVLAVIAAYMVLNLVYTFRFKHEPILDIFTIAAGFVLRVYAGAMALDVPVSSWMFVTTLCLALFLAAVKRRQELVSSGSGSRHVLRRYSLALINRYAEISAVGALVFYSLFVMSSRPNLVVTIPMVLFGLFRYWYVVEALDGGESPTDVVLQDRQLQITVLLWVAACVWSLWP